MNFVLDFGRGGTTGGLRFLALCFFLNFLLDEVNASISKSTIRMKSTTAAVTTPPKTPTTTAFSRLPVLLELGSVIGNKSFQFNLEHMAGSCDPSDDVCFVTTEGFHCPHWVDKLDNFSVPRMIFAPCNHHHPTPTPPTRTHTMAALIC